jgi:hypothetical protein
LAHLLSHSFVVVDVQDSWWLGSAHNKERKRMHNAARGDGRISIRIGTLVRGDSPFGRSNTLPVSAPRRAELAAVLEQRGEHVFQMVIASVVRRGWRSALYVSVGVLCLLSSAFQEKSERKNPCTDVCSSIAYAGFWQSRHAPSIHHD